MSAHYQRARILSDQKKYHLAEKELRQELAKAPQNAETHAFLAEILVEQKRLDEALQEAQRAVHLAPDKEYSYYALAKVYYEQRQLGLAEQAIHEALRLDPNNADDFGLLSAIHYLKGKKEAALQAAENGLRIDPTHRHCNDLLIQTLVSLREAQRAEATIANILPHYPENHVLHTSQGWVCYQRKEYEQALEHFREALRLSPHYDWARQGIIYAIKARSRLYHLVTHTLQNLPTSDEALSQLGMGAAVIPIIMYFAWDEMQNESPLLAFILYLFALLSIAIWILAWYSAPVLNWFVYLHPFGRFTLSEKQRRATALTPIFVGLGLLGILIGLFTDHKRAVFGAISASALIQPVTAIIECASIKRRNVLIFYTISLVVIGILTLFLSSFFTFEVTIILTATFLIGLLGFYSIAEEIFDRLNL